ncbi:zip homologous protein 3 [Halyomorpha halys]|uniref:zip homologous protein 3 n=1 Tax=Halyomorpha halys TaxID=286706 RepID=UPI0034D1DA91
MTSCCHILCDNCTRQDAKICIKCASPCMIVQCNNQMPEEIKEVFLDISDTIPKLIKVLDFQEKNRSKLMAYYRTNVEKYKTAKVYVSELEQKLHTAKQKYEACKVALNKQQSNIEILIKKYQWYKEKCGNLETSSRTPSINLNTSRNILSQPFTPVRGNQPVFSMNAPRTPRTPNSHRLNPANRFLTPESIVSSHKSSNSSGSLTCSSKATMCGFTPPSDSFQLLSLLNKNKQCS